VEHAVTGTDLDGLQTLFLDLTTKIEARVVSLDEALRELQLHEVIDAAGWTWRIDPMTQSFIRRGPGADSWRPADPAEYAKASEAVRGERQGSASQASRTVPPTTPPTVFDVDARPPSAADVAVTRHPLHAADAAEARRPRRGRLVAISATALAVVIAAGVMGLGRTHRNADATSQAVPFAKATPRPTPTITSEAPQLSKFDLKRYQPSALKITRAPRQAVLTWRLPPDAQRDGAGIVVRQEPAEDAPLAALSRTNGRLPETYVAVPLTPHRRYCFLVSALLRKADGSITAAQSGPVCTVAR
jgi:hypothetical protein